MFTWWSLSIYVSVFKLSLLYQDIISEFLLTYSFIYSSIKLSKSHCYILGPIVTAGKRDTNGIVYDFKANIAVKP
jgi:hypothetical protein